MGEKGAKMASASSQAAEALLGRLVELGDIRSKKMFGGHGIFAEDQMFALIDSGGAVFFKAGDANRALFEEVGAEKHGRMPYYRVPDDVLENDGRLVAWARQSIALARS